MLRIINKKRYNTKTAELIADWDNNLACNDFNYCSENLYRTPKGAYFISYSGGAASKYSHTVSGSSTGSDGITPVSDEEALSWLESKDYAVQAEKCFSEEIEDA